MKDTVAKFGIEENNFTETYVRKNTVLKALYNVLKLKATVFENFFKCIVIAVAFLYIWQRFIEEIP